MSLRYDTLIEQLNSSDKNIQRKAAYKIDTLIKTLKFTKMAAKLVIKNAVQKCKNSPDFWSLFVIACLAQGKFDIGKSVPILEKYVKDPVPNSYRHKCVEALGAYERFFGENRFQEYQLFIYRDWRVNHCGPWPYYSNLPVTTETQSFLPCPVCQVKKDVFITYQNEETYGTNISGVTTYCNEIYCTSCQVFIVYMSSDSRSPTD